MGGEIASFFGWQGRSLFGVALFGAPSSSASVGGGAVLGGFFVGAFALALARFDVAAFWGTGLSGAADVLGGVAFGGFDAGFPPLILGPAFPAVTRPSPCFAAIAPFVSFAPSWAPYSDAKPQLPFAIWSRIV